MTYESQEPSQYWVWGYRFFGTPEAEQETDRYFEGLPETLDLKLLRAKLIWHTENPNGREAMVVRLTEEQHRLELEMYDKAEKWATTRHEDS